MPPGFHAGSICSTAPVLEVGGCGDDILLIVWRKFASVMIRPKFSELGRGRVPADSAINLARDTEILLHARV